MRKIVRENVINFVGHLLIKRAQARNLIAKQSREAGRPEVGIFWALPNNEILSQTTAMENAIDYGDSKTSPAEHMGTWRTLQRVANDYPNVRDHEYEYWPRGRINYNKAEDRYYLYADRKILENEKALRAVMKEFNLPGPKTKTSTDPHYQSKGDIGGIRKVPMQTVITMQTTYDDGETHQYKFNSMGELRAHLAKFYDVDAATWGEIRPELIEGEEVDLQGDRVQIINQQQVPAKTGTQQD